LPQRPVIGITTQTLQAIDGIPEGLPPSWVMNQRYFRAVTAEGGVPWMVPLLDDDLETLRAIYDRVDGLLIPGGIDMDPATFGEPPHPALGRIDPPRDRVELTLARWAIDDGKPLFGLCRGLQVINVALGGTLYQDLAGQCAGSLKHDYYPTEGYSRDYPAHDIRISAGTRLRGLLGGPDVRVNSMHHQAVKVLAPGLAASAMAPDGVIEAVEGQNGRFLIGVQWHPESMVETDGRMRALFGALVRAAGESR